MKKLMIILVLCVGMATTSITVAEPVDELQEVKAPEICTDGLIAREISEQPIEEAVAEAEEQVAVKLDNPDVSTVPEAKASIQQVTSQVKVSVPAVQGEDHWAEIYIMAQAMAGESYADDYEDQVHVGMTICNRVDSPRFPNSIQDVITQPWQIHGYSPYNVPAQTYIDAATQVVNAWYAMKAGASFEWWDGSSLFWSASGRHNSFRSEY